MIKLFKYIFTGKTGLEPKLREAKEKAIFELCRWFYTKGALDGLQGKLESEEKLMANFATLYWQKVEMIKNIIR